MPSTTTHATRVEVCSNRGREVSVDERDEVVFHAGDAFSSNFVLRDFFLDDIHCSFFAAYGTSGRTSPPP